MKAVQRIEGVAEHFSVRDCRGDSSHFNVHRFVSVHDHCARVGGASLPQNLAVNPRFPRFGLVCHLCLGFFLLVLPEVAAAEHPAADSTTELGLPRVLKLEGELAAGALVHVTVINLDTWAAKNDPGKLVPFINGRPLTGSYPKATDLRRNRLLFHLENTKANRKLWTDLLGEPSSLQRQVTFSVGLETGIAFPSELEGAKAPLLAIIPTIYGVISLFVIVVTTGVLIWLARHTNLIRDSGPCLVPPQLKPYNLGKAQMAFWFLLTFVSYVVIWLITDNFNTITAGLIGLMGISSFTALGEVLVDASKDATTMTKLLSATSEKAALEQDIAARQAQLDVLMTARRGADDVFARNNLNRELLAKRTRWSVLTQQLEAAEPAHGPAISCGFFRDVLSDAEGYSLHRFQLLAWTIALGVVFVSAVYNDLIMPKFSATLLGLMGTSSGVYSGLKVSEKRGRVMERVESAPLHPLAS